MTAQYGRPTAAELVAAVAEFLDADVRGATDGQVNFHARVAANVLRIVERELGAETTASDEAGLITAIQEGDFDGRDDEAVSALRALVYDRLSVAHPGYAVTSVADRLFASIETGDIDAVAAMWAEDVVVWQVGAHRGRDKTRALRVIDWFLSATSDRRYDVMSRHVFEGGFVQQHTLHGHTLDGGPFSMRVAMIIVVGTDGLITRIDEYFDPNELASLQER